MRMSNQALRLPRYADMLISGWRKARQEVSAGGADQLTIGGSNRLWDVAFMLEPAQLDVLQVQKVALIQLVLVSSEIDQSVEQALGKGYIMVDWGLSHALEHRRKFPDAPEPQVRVGQAKIALGHLLHLGGIRLFASTHGGG